MAFGTDGAAARRLGVTRMTIWRWRHGWAPIPKRVLNELRDLLQTRVEEAHVAQNELRDILALPPRPPRKLSGCCAGLHRRVKKMPVTAANWPL